MEERFTATVEVTIPDTPSAETPYEARLLIDGEEAGVFRQTVPYWEGEYAADVPLRNVANVLTTHFSKLASPST